MPTQHPQYEIESPPLGFVRRTYRSYLIRYPVFRLLKSSLLSTYWKVRGLQYEVRHFYRRYLASYSVFRGLRNAIFAVYLACRRIWIRLSLHYRAATFSLVPVETYASEHGLHTQTVEPAAEIEIPAPRFIGNTPKEYAGINTVRVLSPKLAVTEIADANVIGGTDFVLSGDKAIHSSFYLPAREVCPAETFGEAGIDPGQGLMKTVVPRNRRRIERAATILGQCAGNYAHWLTEILPKLMVLDACEDYDDLPLLIDGWVHPNLHEALHVLNRNKRQIINVGRWEMVSVERVFYVSPVAYIPAEYRAYVSSGKILKTGADEFPFSRTALTYLRDAALKVATPSKKKHRKLYLRRANNGNTRTAVNDEMAEALARQYGFETIEPGSMSFKEQLSVFSDAEVVVGQIGAALSNVIFAKKRCTVIVTSPYYENANYYFWSNLFGMLNHDLYYVIGPQIGSGHPFHKNFKIDLKALEQAFRKLS